MNCKIWTVNLMAAEAFVCFILFKRDDYLFWARGKYLQHYKLVLWCMYLCALFFHGAQGWNGEEVV